MNDQRVPDRLMSDAEAEVFADVGRQVLRQLGEGSIIAAGSMLGGILAALDEASREILIAEMGIVHPHLRLLVDEALRAYETLGRSMVGALELMSTPRRRRFHDLLGKDRRCAGEEAHQ